MVIVCQFFGCCCSYSSVIAVKLGQHETERVLVLFGCRVSLWNRTAAIKYAKFPFYSILVCFVRVAQKKAADDDVWGQGERKKGHKIPRFICWVNFYWICEKFINNNGILFEGSVVVGRFVPGSVNCIHDNNNI